MLRVREAVVGSRRVSICESNSICNLDPILISF